MIDAFFIAGTDTDVGKTVASKAILNALALKDLKTIGYKPLQRVARKQAKATEIQMLCICKKPPHLTLTMIRSIHTLWSCQLHRI